MRRVWSKIPRTQSRYGLCSTTPTTSEQHLQDEDTMSDPTVIPGNTTQHTNPDPNTWATVLERLDDTMRDGLKELGYL